LLLEITNSTIERVGKGAVTKPQQVSTVQPQLQAKTIVFCSNVNTLFKKYCVYTYVCSLFHY